MCCLSSNDRAIVSPRIETEIPRDHKEEGNREATDRLYDNARLPGKLTMHKDYASAC